MSDEVKLRSGQSVQLQDGIVQVMPQSPKSNPLHYKMTAQHKSGALLDVHCADIDSLMAFRQQLEALDYAMRVVVLQP